MKRLVLMAALVAGCGGPPSSPSDLAEGLKAVDCTPSVVSCQGTVVRQCAADGKSWTTVLDCATDPDNIRATNPLVCSTAGDYEYSAVAYGLPNVGCRYEFPVSVVHVMKGATEFDGIVRHSWNYTDPTGSAAQDSSATLEPDGASTIYPDGTTVNYTLFHVVLDEAYPGTDLVEIQAAFNRSLLRPGQTIAFEMLRADTPQLTFGELVAGGKRCTALTGALTYGHRVPDWSITVDLTCVTDSTIAFAGTFTGRY